MFEVMRKLPRIENGEIFSVKPYSLCYIIGVLKSPVNREYFQNEICFFPLWKAKIHL